MNATVKFCHPGGLHARPCCQLATLAKNFNANVFILRNGEKANVRDVLHILSMGIPAGEVVLEADGPEAEKALDALKQAFQANFDEFQ